MNTREPIAQLSDFCNIIDFLVFFFYFLHCQNSKFDLYKLFSFFVAALKKLSI